MPPFPTESPTKTRQASRSNDLEPPRIDPLAITSQGGLGCTFQLHAFSLANFVPKPLRHNNIHLCFQYRDSIIHHQGRLLRICGDLSSPEIRRPARNLTEVWSKPGSNSPRTERKPEVLSGRPSEKPDNRPARERLIGQGRRECRDSTPRARCSPASGPAECHRESERRACRRTARAR